MGKNDKESRQSSDLPQQDKNNGNRGNGADSSKSRLAYLRWGNLDAKIIPPEAPPTLQTLWETYGEQPTVSQADDPGMSSLLLSNISEDDLQLKMISNFL